LLLVNISFHAIHIKIRSKVQVGEFELFCYLRKYNHKFGILQMLFSLKLFSNSACWCR